MKGRQIDLRITMSPLPTSVDYRVSWTLKWEQLLSQHNIRCREHPSQWFVERNRWPKTRLLLMIVFWITGPLSLSETCIEVCTATREPYNRQCTASDIHIGKTPLLGSLRSPYQAIDCVAVCMTTTIGHAERHSTDHWLVHVLKKASTGETAKNIRCWRP